MIARALLVAGLVVAGLAVPAAAQGPDQAALTASTGLIQAVVTGPHADGAEIDASIAGPFNYNFGAAASWPATQSYYDLALSVPCGTYAVSITVSGQAAAVSPPSITVPCGAGAGGKLSQPITAITGLIPANGYWEVTATGAIGGSNVEGYGSLAAARLASPVVAMTSTKDGQGYWLVTRDGGVFTFGDATFHGSLAGQPHAPIVGIGSPDSGGYWLVGSDGSVYSFGDAPFLGSLGSTHLTAPIVGIAAFQEGIGYWLVAGDGGVFTFGVPFFGSAAGTPNTTFVGMAADPDGLGYRLVTSAGGVYDFGQAGFYGALTDPSPGEQIIGIASSHDGAGYWLAGAAGQILTYGDAGSLG